MQHHCLLNECLPRASINMAGGALSGDGEKEAKTKQVNRAQRIKPGVNHRAIIIALWGQHNNLLNTDKHIA